MKIKLNKISEQEANENGFSTHWTYEVKEQVGDLIVINNCHGKDVAIPIQLTKEVK